MSDKLQKIVDHISELSVAEVAELVKALEEKFGVSAAAQVVTTAPAAGGAGDAGAEAQDSFNVVIANAGANKIAVIKALREINPALGLSEAKALSEKAGAVVLENAGKDKAEEAKKKLTDAGATVELK